MAISFSLDQLHALRYSTNGEYLGTTKKVVVVADKAHASTYIGT